MKFEPDEKSLIRLRRQLERELPKDAKKLAREATRELLLKGRTRMKAEAPRLTGLLRRAIFFKMFRSKKGQPEGGDLRIHMGKGAQKKNKDAFYWRFLEHGTKKMVRQKFVAPTLAYMQSIQQQVYQDKFLIALEKLWKQKR